MSDVIGNHTPVKIWGHFNACPVTQAQLPVVSPCQSFS